MTESAIAALAERSTRTLAVGVAIDRDAARLLQYTLKDRPFGTPALEPPRPFDGVGKLQLEMRLLDGKGNAFTRRVEVGPLCFRHGAGEPPHIDGDTILLHRDGFLVELPALPGFDRIDAAWYASDGRRAIGKAPLGRAQFNRAGGSLGVEALPFPAVSDEPGSVGVARSSLTPGTVHWPEEFSDPDIYQIWGDPEGGAERLNIVLIPDGYTYAEKALMEQHALDMVTHLRDKTPYAEHDPFINYTLVYAYSTESATDECDCSTLIDTAMGTYFPNAGYPCQNAGNRCLYYGAGGCDTDGTANIVAAEARAPYHDKTVLMVNTTRYGGCGGSRATYAASNPSALEIAAHELGHSTAGLADEYADLTGCAGAAGEINSSLNATSGAWPEWIADLGAPRLGAQRYPQCIYRPADNCMMRALDQPFCPVCNQRWALSFYGHPRIAPTAPVRSSSPGPNVNVSTTTPVTFTITPRFASGASVTNSITWTLQGPGFPTPTVVATDVTNYTRTFSPKGKYTLRCEVIGDTNFVKPPKNGANVDTPTWSVRSH